MAYAMYLRKSRADEELGYDNTLERHEEMLRNLAAQTGIHVDEAHIFREIVSGESIEARPQMQRLLKAVEMGLYTGVLCIELERLSRGDGADQQRILKAFQFSDTKIITLTKTYDLAGDDSFDEEFFEFGLFMSRREYKMIKKRLYRGRIQAQKEGYFIGSRPPYGYDKKRIGKGYVLVPNENAEVVRYIFRRYAQHDTAANILHDLNNMAIPTVTGAKWTAYAIREVIKNQTYIGKINTKTVRCEKSIKDGKVVQRWLNNYEPVVVEGKHEPIVDEELFWRCQEVRDSKKTRTRSDQTLKNPFASIMFCNVCGKTMRRTHYDYKGERTFCYGCQTSRCETKNTFTHVVYDMVIDELKKELERQLVVLADYDASPDHDARMDELEMLRAELSKKSMMLERACEAYETGIYDRQTYLERVQKVNAARAELQARAEELEKSIEESEERHEKAVPILTRVVEEMHTLEPKEQNDLLKMIVDRIEYEKTESGAAIEPTLRISLKI